MRRLALLALALSATAALAAGEPEFKLSLENHKFTPDRLEVPAGKKVKLVIENKDATPEEFESKQLNREKVIPAGAKATLYIGPLKPGRYDFYGEYHESTAKGVVVAE